MKKIVVTLGGREYELRPLPIRASRAWRNKFSGPLDAVAGALGGIEQVDLTSGAALAALITTLKETLLGSVDILLDMLFAYSPELEADRERIETEAFDEEALTALVEVLRLAYPLGALAGLIRGPAK